MRTINLVILGCGGLALGMLGGLVATGMLTPPGDAAAMAAAVRHVFADAGRLRALGENAVRRARTHYDLAGQAARHLAAYERQIARWRAARSSVRV